MTAPLILGTNSIKDTSYDVANSVRMDIGSSDHFEKTPSSAVTGERKKFTVSCWLKRSVLGGEQAIISAGNGAGSEEFEIVFNSDNTLQVKHDDASSVVHQLVTKMKFVDTAAWFHIVYVYDSANATEALRARLFVNGVELTNANSDFSTYNAVSSNDLTPMNVDERHHVGSTSFDSGGSGASFFGGYMAEFYQTAGQANIASVFGEYDSDSPTIWKPKNPSGLSFGTNGFYLDFEDSSNLGKDVSGNTNNFTVDNLTSIDQSTDTCTNNFTTWNPLDSGREYSGTIGLKNGNLTQDNANDASLISTVALNKGKWYMEFKCEDADNTRTFGIIDIAESNGYVGHPSIASAVSYGYKSSDGTLWIGTSEQASSVGTTSAGDIVSMLIDLDSGTKTIKWKKNNSDLSGTTQLTISHSTSDYYFGIICRCDGGQIISANFGSPPYSISSGNTDGNGYGNFEYAVPSGYFALNTKNLAEYG
tara:strand:+ start:189 stop:1619 length:1431 start_codon:yes stop_codon:yes gene_type:complete